MLCALLLVLLASTGAFAQNLNMTIRGRQTYPGNTIANVSGWAANGREYALLGGSKGMIIVDVTDPDHPQKITQIPGPDNTWKEIKTFLNYAYIVSEGGQGLQIVDLSGLPSPNLLYHHYTGDGAIADQLNTIHALHIDLAKGYLYCYGSNLFNGGAVVLDLNGDPYNPTFVGKFDQLGYIHDGYVDNDTLYAGHIGAGFFSVVNMTNKAAPELLNFQPTPNHATHNTWLSQNRRVIFTTDEVDDSYLAAYDVTDPSDIQLLDKMQANPGSGSVVHNTHILNNFAITSWYTSGVNVVDVTRPQNLVQVGIYDTWPNSNAGGFDGCWGTYPYLPSGNIIAANIPMVGFGTGELFVITPNYVRACYLEGKITDANTGAPVAGASIEITNGDPSAKDVSTVAGDFKTGQAQAGSFSVKVSKAGYQPFTATVSLASGEVTVLDVVLVPLTTFAITGAVIEKSTGLPVPNAHVALIGQNVIFEGVADANGQFAVPGVYAGIYSVVGGAWGYLYGQLNNQNLTAPKTFTLQLDKGYRDDFIFDYGWQASGTSVTGQWERAEPVGVNPGILLVPETDLTGDLGDKCYLTGNGGDGQPGADDVESGTAILTSPVMDLSGYAGASLRGFCFFTNFTQQGPLPDSLKFYVSNGSTEVLAGHLLGDQPGWRPFNLALQNLLPLTSEMRLRVVADESPSNPDFDSYEVALDFFRVTDLLVGTDAPGDLAALSAFPNPFRDETAIAFATPTNGYTLRVFDLLGRLVQTQDLQDQNGSVRIGQGLTDGVYFAQLEHDGQVARTIKLVKTGR